MKISIIGTRGIPARYGGFETAAEEIAVGLVKKGHQVSVYCRKNNADPKIENYKNVNLRYLPHLDSKNIGTLSHSLLAIINASFRRYEMILAFNVGIAPLCLIPKLFGIPVVLNVDGLEWKRRKWGFIARSYFRFCEKIVQFTADKVVTDSKAIQSYYQESYNIPSIYIPYGARNEKSNNLKILKKYCIRRDEYFFNASRLEPENNADLIIEAFKKVQTNKKLLIAGGANYKSSYIKEIMRTKDPRIVFLGPVYKENHIKELHCNCYAYIHGNEVGGTNPALLKALGYGNCVLALDVSYNREVVGDAAILFRKSTADLGRKLNYVLKNPNSRKFYQRYAKERIQKYYSWKKVVEKYEELFRTLT